MKIVRRLLRNSLPLILRLRELCSHFIVTSIFLKQLNEVNFFLFLTWCSTCIKPRGNLLLLKLESYKEAQIMWTCREGNS